MGNKTEGKKIPAAVHEDFGEKIGGEKTYGKAGDSMRMI